VNRFTGESELEVTTTRLVDHPYDPARREAAEAKQLAKLAEIKRVRDSRQVKRCLKEVRRVARTDDNIMPATIEAVKAYATVGEVCDVLREVFGEYEPAAY
jgi:methylmalonyl-CoA mutase N-terminal domain/subunit